MEPKEKAVQPKPAQEDELSDQGITEGAEPSKDETEVSEGDAEISRSE